MQWEPEVKTSKMHEAQENEGDQEVPIGFSFESDWGVFWTNHIAM